ncbi:uncharacterized protein LOC125561771 [Nematostella vectensis]|uniref:uncharacterized protein LOC125561771 n=1 Tax=Nematostella vectensis TaxID=45351 RepID=UPI0020775E23|nr:uncharacterized protein LOC125561771 [Nematostella vectensis]
MLWLIVGAILGTILGIVEYLYPELQLLYLPKLIAGKTCNLILQIEGSSSSDLQSVFLEAGRGSFGYSTITHIPDVFGTSFNLPVNIVADGTALAVVPNEAHPPPWEQHIPFIWTYLATTVILVIIVLLVDALTKSDAEMRVLKRRPTSRRHKRKDKKSRGLKRHKKPKSVQLPLYRLPKSKSLPEMRTPAFTALPRSSSFSNMDLKGAKHSTLEDAVCRIRALAQSPVITTAGQSLLDAVKIDCISIARSNSLPSIIGNPPSESAIKPRLVKSLPVAAAGAKSTEIGPTVHTLRNYNLIGRLLTRIKFKNTGTRYTAQDNKNEESRGRLKTVPMKIAKFKTSSISDLTAGSKKATGRDKASTQRSISEPSLSVGRSSKGQDHLKKPSLIARVLSVLKRFKSRRPSRSTSADVVRQKFHQAGQTKRCLSAPVLSESDPRLMLLYDVNRADHSLLPFLDQEANGTFAFFEKSSTHLKTDDQEFNILPQTSLLDHEQIETMTAPIPGEVDSTVTSKPGQTAVEVAEEALLCAEQKDSEIKSPASLQHDVLSNKTQFSEGFRASTQSELSEENSGDPAMEPDLPEVYASPAEIFEDMKCLFRALVENIKTLNSSPLSTITAWSNSINDTITSAIIPEQSSKTQSPKPNKIKYCQLVTRGTRHQGWYDLACPGVQCATMAYLAVLRSCIKDIRKWTSQDLDSLIKTGDKEHSKRLTEVKLTQSSALLIDELNLQIKVWNRQFIVQKEVCCGDIIKDVSSWTDECTDPYLPLERSFEQLKYYNKFLLRFMNLTIAIIRTSTGWIMYDSHARDNEGYADPDGFSVLLAFDDVTSVIKHIRQFVDCKGFLEMSNLPLNEWQRSYELVGLTVMLSGR